MDKIWDRKSFKVGGHWPLWRGWKNRMTTQNRQKSRTLIKKRKEKKSCLSPDMTDLPWVEWVFYHGILYTLSPRSYSCIYKWTRYSGTLPLASPQTTWTGNQSTNNKVTVLSYRYRMDVTLKSYIIFRKR